MADGGRTDEWAPNSDLNSDPADPGQNYDRADGVVINVKVNDWVDLDTVIPSDPLWGSSFQVCEVQPEQIMVRMIDPGTGLYAPVAVSPEYIQNNYRRVPSA